MNFLIDLVQQGTIAVGMKIAGDHRRAKRLREQSERGSEREGEEVSFNQATAMA